MGYPYYGYYRHYPSYLYDYGYGDCGFYSGYSLRFGYYRSSYYHSCSGYGYHASPDHHQHTYICPLHGRHTYHVRDCYLCEPNGGPYHEVDLPDDYDAGAPDQAPVEKDGEGGEPQGEARQIEAPEPTETEELFFASLRPAQLSFALGLVHVREAEYQRATEAFYNATIEDPESRLAKVFLASALFSIGEFEHAASYLKLALAEWPEFPLYRWDFKGLYGSGRRDFASHLALLEEHVRLYPLDQDAHLLRAFVLFTSGDLAASAASLHALEVGAEDLRTRAVAATFVRELESRNGSYPRGDLQLVGEAAGDAQGRFLSTLKLADLPAVEMR
ncbi:MAG: hypothetical protein O7J95_10620 [Planctomycetota bacterium]|nr:hypothetical protein [Planctomycetota bacterium]